MNYWKFDNGDIGYGDQGDAESYSGWWDMGYEPHPPSAKAFSLADELYYLAEEQKAELSQWSSMMDTCY